MCFLVLLTADFGLYRFLDFSRDAIVDLLDIVVHPAYFDHPAHFQSNPCEVIDHPIGFNLAPRHHTAGSFRVVDFATVQVIVEYPRFDDNTSRVAVLRSHHVDIIYAINASVHHLHILVVLEVKHFLCAFGLPD